MGINIKINKISYNSSQHVPKEEEVTVELVSKFGIAKEDLSLRVFFFEININGTDIEDGRMSRSLMLEAAFQYKISNDELNEETEEDNYMYGKCLEILNEKIEIFTSQDNRTPFNINSAVDEFNSK